MPVATGELAAKTSALRRGLIGQLPPPMSYLLEARNLALRYEIVLHHVTLHAVNLCVYLMVRLYAYLSKLLLLWKCTGSVKEMVCSGGTNGVITSGGGFSNVHDRVTQVISRS